MSHLQREIQELFKSARVLWRDEAAVSSMEYVFLLCVLSLAALVAFGELSEEVKDIARKSSYVLERGAGMGCYNGD